MYFVEEYKSPFSRSKEIHHLLRIMRSFLSIRYHRIRRDNNTRITDKL